MFVCAASTLCSLTIAFYVYASLQTQTTRHRLVLAPALLVVLRTTVLSKVGTCFSISRLALGLDNTVAACPLWGFMRLPGAALVGFLDNCAGDTLSTSKNAIPSFVRALAKTDNLSTKWGDKIHRVVTIASDALVIRTCRVQFVQRGDYAAVCAAGNISTDFNIVTLLPSAVDVARVIPI